MKRSIGVRGQRSSFTFGSGGVTGVRNAQCFSHFAPSATQRRSVSIWVADSSRPEFFGGIRSSGSFDTMRRISSLSPGFARNDRGVAVALALGVVLMVEAQISLAAGAVGAVAVVALIRQDRQHVAIEADGLGTSENWKERDNGNGENRLGHAISVSELFDKCEHEIPHTIFLLFSRRVRECFGFLPAGRSDCKLTRPTRRTLHVDSAGHRSARRQVRTAAQGDYSQETVFGDDPVSMARRWVGEGRRSLHLVDLDGAKEGKPVNGEVIRRIVEAVDVPCQVGGGLRREADIQSALEDGVARVVLGTRALQDPAWVRQMAQEYPKQIVLGLDARDGKVATHGWLNTSDASVLDVAREFTNWPLLRDRVHGHLQGRNAGRAQFGRHGGIGRRRAGARDCLGRRDNDGECPRPDGKKVVRLHHRPSPV